LLIVDSGPLVAAASTRDVHHPACAALLRSAAGPIVVPELVVVEVAYILASRLGSYAEVAFARAIANGELEVAAVGDAEWGRIAELVERYEDLGLGITDASVIALTERFGASELATLDHRHFSVVEPRHVRRLTLLPGQ